jgi:hypothetical protein
VHEQAVNADELKQDAAATAQKISVGATAALAWARLHPEVMKFLAIYAGGVLTGWVFWG